VIDSPPDNIASTTAFYHGFSVGHAFQTTWIALLLPDHMWPFCICDLAVVERQSSFKVRVNWKV
jgi:hypothetical protein